MHCIVCGKVERAGVEPDVSVVRLFTTKSYTRLVEESNIGVTKAEAMLHRAASHNTCEKKGERSSHWLLWRHNGLSQGITRSTISLDYCGRNRSNRSAHSLGKAHSAVQTSLQREDGSVA